MKFANCLRPSLARCACYGGVSARRFSALRFAILALLLPATPLPAAEAPKGDAAFFHLGTPGGWVMTPDLVTLIVSVPKEAKLVYFDTVTNQQVKEVEVDFKPGALALQGSTLFAATDAGAVVYALDAKTAKVKKEFTVPGDAISKIACHPAKGLVYASTTSLKVFSIDPASGKVTQTKAAGHHVVVDPVKGDVVFTAIQPPRHDEELTVEVGKDSLKFIWDNWGSRAVILKYRVTDKGLEFVAAQRNATVNGWMLHLTPDGKRVMMVGGGGWRPPAGTTTAGGGYVVAVYSADNLQTMLGQAPHGSGIAFHPVLNLGITNHHGLDVSVFSGKSLVTRKQIHVAKNADRDSRVLTFGGKGTKVILWNGDNPANPVEGLHFLPLELSADDREALTTAYGTLPPPTKLASVDPDPKSPLPKDPNVAPSTKPPPTPLPMKSSPSASVPTTKSTTAKLPRTKLPGPRAAAVVRGTDAKGLISTTLRAGRDSRIVESAANLAYITDRDYAITKLPKSMEGTHALIRSAGRTENWLQKGELVAAKDCTAYVAIMVVNMEGKRTITEAQEESLPEAGWKIVNEPFETVAASQWIVLTRDVSKGDVKLPLPKTFSYFRAHVVYAFK